jgi:HECT-like Ubiquitin-conjugating enzyme (E2)-binding
MGTQDASAEGWRLYKSSLSVRASLDSQWEKFPPQIFVSSQLLSLIESSAARKFVVHTDEARPGLLVSLWTECIIMFLTDCLSPIGLGL